MLNFGPFQPDQPDLENGGLLDARNVIPRLNSYSPLSGVTAYTDALNARCQGAAAIRDQTGNTHWFAGTVNKLYHITTGTSWDDVSQATTTYVTSEVNRWNFCQFGPRVIATNYNNDVQNYILASSTDFNDLYVGFKAKYCAVVRDFVVYGFINESGDGEQSQRVWWTGINDPTTITPSAITQSDYQDLVGDGGEITGIVTGLAGADAIIVQRNALTKMNYTGDQLIFRFDKVEGAKGCAYPGSISQYAGMFFYLSEDGWYKSDGISSEPIGATKINKWFFERFLTTSSHLMSSMIDPINQLMLCNFPDTQAGTTANKLLLYNFFVKKFTYGDLASEFIFPAYTLATDIDSFSTTSIDAIPFSLDSAVYAGGLLRVAAFDNTHMMNFLNGDALEATLETGEAQITPGKRSFVTEIWPKIDGGTWTVQLGSRNKPDETLSWTSAIDVNAFGFAPFRSDARYHRVKLVGEAGGSWEHAQGLDPKVGPSSWR
jgi:hypothetical protein